MASAELLKMTSNIDSKVMGIDDKVKGVDGKVQDVRRDVHGVQSDVHDVRSDVHDVRSDVHDVRNDVRSGVHVIRDDVQGVDDKLDQVNSSLFFLLASPLFQAYASLQGTTSEIVFLDGFHPPIHPPIITMHAKLITAARLNGFSKEAYSINGNPLTPSCGYMENVRHSWPSKSVNS